MSSNVKRYIELFAKEEPWLGEILEILADEVVEQGERLAQVEKAVQSLAQNCSCTVKERMSGHKTGCTVPEVQDLMERR